MTPREWFETYGSKPELRKPPKRRHFAAVPLFAAKCRRLGGSLAAGFQPAKKDSRFSTSCSASLLNAAY